MKKFLALAVSIAFMAPFLNSPAFGAVKAGSTCPKAGSTSISSGKKYTCIRSGKKLIWDTGKLSVAALPAPTDSPTPLTSVTPSKPQSDQTNSNSNEKIFQPWSTTASGLEVAEAAQNNFRNWVNSQKRDNASHQLLIQAGTPTERAKNFTLADNLGTQLFSQYFIGTSSTVIGKDEKWVLEQLKQKDPAFTDCSYSAGNPGLSYCQLGGRFQGYVASLDSNFDRSNLGIDGSSLLAHEYFHLVQNQMSGLEKKPVIKTGESDTQDLFPAWLVEGSANFVGFSVAAMAMGTTYVESRPAMLTYAPKDPSLNRNALADYEIRNGLGNNSPTYPYITGQLATEYLVASVGFQKLLDIWINFQSSGSFEKSFEKSVGISKSEFYEKFEKERLSLGLPAVSWKLVCLTNTPIGELTTAQSVCPLNSSTKATSNQNSSSSDKPLAPIDKNSNADGQGCTQGDVKFSNNFGTFTCVMLPNGNHLWQKSG
jgi:hypothetical protein